MSDKRKILQIIPAVNGWYAVYDYTAKVPPIQIVPVVCFALVEYEDGTRGVIPMDGAPYSTLIEECDGVESYKGLIHITEINGEIEKMAPDVFKLYQPTSSAF